MNKKAQSAIEFIILIGALLFFLTLFSAVIQQSISKKAIAQRNLVAQDIALTVQNEIDLAATSSDGYLRMFSIPTKIINVDYEINVTQGIVYLRTEDGNIELALAVQETVGNVQKGENTIKKIDGVVYLNQ